MKKRLISVALVIAVVCSMCVGVAGASSRFKDVPDNHWALTFIEALADGGLVAGYGNNLFGPDDALNVDQLAAIICSAKGVAMREKDGYWAYGAVEHCRDKLKCLPSFGETSMTNYSVPCTRELALYMITKGLGATGVTPRNDKITASDIPDYDQISGMYASTVLEAYRLGLVAGVDDKGTCLPKAILSRGQACTILYRAGYTTNPNKTSGSSGSSGTGGSAGTGTGTQTPDKVYKTGMTTEEIYKEISSWGIWKDQQTTGGYKYLLAKDPIYGGITVEKNSDGILIITAPESNRSAWVDAEKNIWIDTYGNKVPESLYPTDFIDTNGKMVLSSGYQYEARQLIKKILAVAYPEHATDVYNAFMGVLRQELYESPNATLPSAVRFMDGRAMQIGMGDGGNYFARIYIHPTNSKDKAAIEKFVAQERTVNKSVYAPQNCSDDQFIAAYELNRY